MAEEGGEKGSIIGLTRIRVILMFFKKLVKGIPRIFCEKLYTLKTFEKYQ